MRKRILASIIFSGMVILPALASASSLVVNGSFETGTNPGAYLTVNASDSSTIANWSVDTGSVDYIGSYWSASDGGRSIDLNGLAAGTISQTFPTVIGDTYTVAFDLSGNPDSSADPSLTSPSDKVVQVSATGGAPHNFDFDTTAGNSKANMMWQPETYTFIATGANTTLTFASQIAGAFGPALDNVVVTQTSAPAPASCPVGTVQSPLIETVSVDSSAVAGAVSHATLANGTTYLLQSSGTWQNSNINAADTEFASVDHWATVMDGYNVAPFFLGEGEFDLQVDNAFVNWGPYNTSHTYTQLYSGTGNPVALRIFDGDSNTSFPNAGWYGDNSGALSVNIYSCDAPQPPPSPVPTTKAQCMQGGWKNLTDGTNHFKNQGDCVSFVATKGKNVAAGH